MDSSTSCVGISVLVQRVIQNSTGHPVGSEGVSSLAVRGRHEHRTILSNYEKNFVVKYLLLVLIKQKGCQQSPLLEKLEPELGNTLLNEPEQWFISTYKLHGDNLFIIFFTVSFSIRWLSQKAAIKVNKVIKIRCLAQSIDHSQRSNSCIFSHVKRMAWARAWS